MRQKVIKILKNNPYKVLWKLYRCFVPNKKLAALMLFFHLIARLVVLLSPYIMAKIINTIQIWWPNVWENVLLYLILLTFIPLIEWIFHGTARVWEEKLRFQTNKAYQLHLFKIVTSFPMERHNDHHSWETIDKIQKASSWLDGFAGNMFMYLGTFITLIGSFAALIIVWPTAAIILPFMSLIIFVLVWIFDTHIVRLIKEQNKKDHKISSTLFDYLSNIKTIITLRFVEKTRSALGIKIDASFIPFKKRIVINERKWFLVSMILAITIWFMLWWYIYQQLLITGTLLIGNIIMLFQYMQQASGTFYNITWQYSELVQSKANIGAVDDILKNYKRLTPSYKLPPIKNRKQITIKDLQFTYKDTHQQSHTLTDINMSFHPWEKIAIIGESGSGKSTFLSLIRGLYDVDNVEVIIDKKKYDHLHILSHNTSLIPQDPEIFEDTLHYNISFGLNVEQNIVEQFSNMANIHDVIKKLPSRYKTNIKEKWVNLSWGQKQRLALARGLLVSQDSDIILLDESTSSVDSTNEKKIYENIFNTYPNKTIIAAIHKLHLLPMFETIYLFDNGQIKEYGSFESLLEQKGMFVTMRKQYHNEKKQTQ